MALGTGLALTGTLFYLVSALSMGRGVVSLAVIGCRERWPASLGQKGDRRVARVGSLIKKTGLDELPQLLNVLRGQMNVVGRIRSARSSSLSSPSAFPTTSSGIA